MNLQESYTCKECGEQFFLDDGLDPSDFCNLCAQKIAANSPALVKRAKTAEAAVKHLDAELTSRDRDRERLVKELEELKHIIADPASVWINMLRGTIARPRALEHYEECKAALETAERERDESRRQAAAMREAIKVCTGETPGGGWLIPCPRCGFHRGHAADCIVGQALASAAGQDFVPLAKLERLKIRIAALEDALKQIRAIDDGDWEQAGQIARACLDGATPTDYVPSSELEAVQKQATAMREVLNTLVEDYDPGCELPRQLFDAARCATANSACQDFVPLTDMEPLIVQVKRYVRLYNDGIAIQTLQAWTAKHPSNP